MIRIRIYAHWTQNPLSEWTLSTEVPENATVEDTKWTYTQRTYTTDSAASLEGWTKYDTQRTSWGAKQGPVYSNPSNGERNVTSEQYVKSYNYKTVYHYYCYAATNADTGSAHTYLTGQDAINIGCPYYRQLDLDYELPKTNQLNGNYLYNNNWYYWACNPYTTQVATSANYGTRWYYQEPVYTYYYYQDNDLEAATYPSGDDISNIVEWVQYRVK